MSEQNTFEAHAVAWQPLPEVIERAQLTKFMAQTGAQNFAEVYAKSIESPEEFTKNVLDFLKIEFNPPYEKLLDTSDGIEWAKWCVGGGLNITEMCVDRWANDETTANQPAIIREGEEGEAKTVSYKELLAQIEYCAAGLRANGLQKGDAIGIHLPMMIETVVALLAVNRIGAIAVPVFSGYGVDAIASRMNAVEAKSLITCDGFFRRGKAVNALQTALQAVTRCKFIERVFVVEESRGDFEEEFQKRRLAKTAKPEEKLSKAVIYQDDNEHTEADLKLIFSVWEDLIEEGRNYLSEAVSDYVSAEPTLAEDPLIILYTSGTTGKPKGIAHTHCGFPVKAAQDMAFGTDVGQGTRISWVTDIGWMMGPWLIYGALINGATICIYDGAPDYPNADRMWEFCAKHRIEILGISPTLVRSLATKGDDLPKRHDLSALRAFASTGEPWNPAPWWWLFETVGNSELPIINYSGGTEISGGILMGNPLLPIKPCSFPAPCPGIDVAILDEQGNQVEKGKVGELSIRKPWIGMARGFWQEPERYIDTYWSRFDNIWVHGDWALQDADGHFYILGRSDDTLKVAGKRVGPAEVESLLVAHPLVSEAAVIGVPDEIKGTAMIAFCVLNGEQTSLIELRTELKQLVAKDMGKPLAPSKIIFVSALPKTRNAKVMRRVIRSAYLGEDAGDLSALENPDAVKEIAEAAKG
ncbi:MAG: AMP-binding protein [Pyrinomonadaceae bacterium]|nr:AMP-binding protein [Pyrinomonadaceae bacterium]